MLIVVGLKYCFYIFICKLCKKLKGKKIYIKKINVNGIFLFLNLEKMCYFRIFSIDIYYLFVVL